MNKRGFLKIIEASIAIMIVISVLAYFSLREQAPPQANFSERARNILDEIAKNVTLRDDVLQENSASINEFVAKKIPENYLAYETRICDVGSVCGKTSLTKGNVYAGERIISSSIPVREFEPKKIRLFIWEKE